MSRFTLLLVVFGVCLVVVPVAIARLTEEVKRVCREETGISEADATNFDPKAPIPERKRCYIRCLFDRGGYLGTDGEVFVDQMRTDQIAEGNETRLTKVYGCVEETKYVKECAEIEKLVHCFNLD